jgi:hypothetical protein
MFRDRRLQSRQPVGLEAFVQVPLRAPMPAFVTNVSPDGAMVEVERFEFVPNTFKLILGDFETTCYVRHRDRKHIGIEFATTYDMAYDASIYAANADAWSGQGAQQGWR